MGKIIQLDDHLANKIAAGEVVERPASVVKELVENSIDANSSVIEIEVEEAGLSKIRVIDNGDGIEEDDCLAAFQRHATSKIKDENDLFRIKTLGFRGEALPSIASVSELEIKTSTGDEAGTRLLLRGGEVIVHEKTNSRKGTDITVSNLFFNTPARLKYLKTVHTELGNISDVVNRLAMAHPHISFRLSHNGKKLLSTNGNGHVLQVISAIYGVQVAKKMIPIHAESLDFTVKGYISLPELTRASRNYISIIINGRFVKNISIAKAIQEGYHTLLPVGRYPIVFLQIEMDPLLVDVNVHPAKLEVRLSKENELYELIVNAIKDAFKTKQLIPEISSSVKITRPQSEQQKLIFDHVIKNEPETPIKTWNAENTNVVNEKKEDDLTDIQIERAHPSSVIVSETMIKESAVQENEQKVEQMKEENNSSEFNEENLSNETVERVPPMYPIGQMHGTYILAQNERGLYIIDQHAAQERINYEYFREKVGQVDNELQDLLVPLTFHYSADEYMIIEEHKEELAKVGIFLEPFGHNSFIVRSHPQWFPKGKETEIIEEMIDQVLKHKKVDIHKLREEAAIMMSCKAAIKANQYLRNDEIFALLETLRKTSDPFTCPHGRPIIIHYSTYEMEKMFKRVM
jgi:DNA mismatch repair protein MutL